MRLNKNESIRDLGSNFEIPKKFPAYFFNTQPLAPCGLLYLGGRNNFGKFDFFFQKKMCVIHIVELRFSDSDFWKQLVELYKMYYTLFFRKKKSNLPKLFRSPILPANPKYPEKSRFPLIMTW